MTKLTVSITAGSPDEATADLHRAAKMGADTVEVRLDHVRTTDYASLIQASPLPILWTLRHESEGGKFVGSISEQIDQLAAATVAGGEYVDIEYKRWIEAGGSSRKLVAAIEQARSSGRKVKLILSYHDFEAMPSHLGSLAKQISQAPHVDVVKIAGYVRHVRDIFGIFDLFVEADKPVIGIGMGPLGEGTRILARKLGGELTFASLEPGKASAPGQLTVSEMREDYRWDTHHAETLLAAVVGHPVEHSLSPIMHNRAYAAMGLDAVYLKFNVPDTYDEFAEFVDSLRSRPRLNCMGLSVTIPHKGHAIDYLRAKQGHIDPLAEKIGAVNTLVFARDGSVAGYNTDYVGVLETLRVSAGVTREDLQGRRVAVLGSGGVARAIVGAMTSAGADVVIFNRTEAKSRLLAEEFGCRWLPWDRRNSAEADILINGTSLGMHPKVQECAVSPEAVKPGMIVFDTVYNPLETILLGQARQAGARAINGADMLVFQAVEQIRLWLKGQQREEFSIPDDIMKKAVLSKLKSRDH